MVSTEIKKSKADKSKRDFFISFGLFIVGTGIFICLIIMTVNFINQQLVGLGATQINNLH